jgi:hypothetical protein
MVMASRGMFATSELMPLLAARGLFTSQLTDLVAALLLAPVSDETRRLFRS